ncbi:MAG: D-alanyl-D-alanine carboxypeptidase [Parcubacteria group bacterium]|nr:MAG: D-alanyl-D-alanine carboxypeptidase [Parcubacteria group bacterium]
MSKSFKYFLLALVFSIPLWSEVNILEKNLNSFFFWHETYKNPEVFAAQMAPIKKEDPKPIRNTEIEDLNIEANSVISVLVDRRGQERIIFEKQSNQQMPIASLTKLMTALVVMKNYDLSREIIISEEAIGQEEEFGKLTAGKALTTEYLLYPLLMESSNDAAFSLANDYPGMKKELFVDLMNQEAQELNLGNTFFANPTGLDPDSKTSEINLSSASDLAKLTKETIKESLLWQILSTPKYQIYGPELVNTNRLLEDSVSWHDEIIGGKTGYTDLAGGCIILVLRAPKDPDQMMINVILGAKDANSRFEEMKKLVNWLDLAYLW